MPRRSLAVLGLVAASALALTACSSGVSAEEGSSSESSAVRYVTVTTPEGETVPCVVYRGYRQGGITCDWEATR